MFVTRKSASNCSDPDIAIYTTTLNPKPLNPKPDPVIVNGKPRNPQTQSCNPNTGASDRRGYDSGALIGSAA